MGQVNTGKDGKKKKGKKSIRGDTRVRKGHGSKWGGFGWRGRLQSSPKFGKMMKTWDQFGITLVTVHLLSISQTK